MFNQELEAYLKLGGKIQYETQPKKLIFDDNRVKGIVTDKGSFYGDAVILASGGFEAIEKMKISIFRRSLEICESQRYS